MKTTDSKPKPVNSHSAVKASVGAKACRRKFLHFFPKGFSDEKYFAWERGYKLAAHEKWNEWLEKKRFAALLEDGNYLEIASRAVKIESPTNLLFSFEKMALRDAVRTEAGAQTFAEGLFAYLYNAGKPEDRFEHWREAVERLPKKQSRVLTYPVLTVFPFLAQPAKHIFLKPLATRRAAERYGFDFNYQSAPSWRTYSDLLDFAAVIYRDMADLKPQDMIDIQSFMWVNGSDEYSE
jgi:hypothetical protein